jgi:hypothetical protein
MSKQLLVSTILAGAAVVAVAPTAAAQTAPSGVGPRPSDATLEVQPVAGIPGTTVTVIGTGCIFNGRPGIGKAVIGDGIIPINPSPADAEGTWKTSAEVPADTPAGRYEIIGGCGSAQGSWSYEPITFFVTGAGSPRVTVSASRVERGDAIKVSGGGCATPRAHVEVGDFFRGAGSLHVTNVTPSRSGAWETTLTVPADAFFGNALIGANCIASDGTHLAFYIPANVEVVADTGTPAPPSAPTTRPKAVKVKPRFTG